MRIGVPAYFDPAAQATDWRRLRTAAPPVALAIVNPNSGPGDVRHTRYVTGIERAATRGLAVLGYVSTAYGTRPATHVRDDIERWYDWYRVDGIFLDEVSPDIARLEYYAAASALIRDCDRERQWIVFNPGVEPAEPYMELCDIVVNWEGTWTAYGSSFPNRPDWTIRFPADHFWHIVHDCSGISDMRRALELALERRAGWVYVTSGSGANPYGGLPDTYYWLEELRWFDLHQPDSALSSDH